MSFNPDEFIKSEVSLQRINVLVKSDLLTLANFLKLSVDPKAKKSVIKDLVVSSFVKSELLSEEDYETLHKSDQSDLELAKLKLHFQERELELRYQSEREEREFELRKIELETRKLQIEHDPISVGTSSPNFDVARNIRLVPRFNEREVEKYFLHFEKIAESMKWPKDVWSLMLQSVLTGKAQETCSSLSVEQCSKYDIVKNAVLKCYELVPEAYR